MSAVAEQQSSTGTERMTYREALRLAMREELARDERVFIMGEEVGVFEGSYKVTAGLMGEFGPERVRDTPISEEGFVGAAVGAAMGGERPIVEIMTINFLLVAIDQVVNHAAKVRTMFGGEVGCPMVIRTPNGAGNQLTAQHSQSLEAWFAHTPGLKVVAPAFPSDAKGLMKSAIRADNPVVYLEHKWIYRRIKEQVPEDPDFLVPIGEAAVKRPGDDVTVIASGMMVHLALEAAENLAAEGIALEVVDLRSIMPLDTETILESVAKTSHALVLYESHRFLGIGAEVASVIAEEAFADLDAPVMRLAPPNVPIPFSPSLEDAYLPQVSDIADAVRKLAAW
jgi:pyruvate dehydrogenase E1 component beta subunit